DGGDGVDTGISVGERVVVLQGGSRVAARKVDCAAVGRDDVAELVHGGDGVSVQTAGPRRRGEAGDEEAAGVRRVDHDARLCAGDCTGGRIGGRWRLGGGGAR